MAPRWEVRWRRRRRKKTGRKLKRSSTNGKRELLAARIERLQAHQESLVAKLAPALALAEARRDALRLILAKLGNEIAAGAGAQCAGLRVIFEEQQEIFPPRLRCDVSKISDGMLMQRVSDALPGAIQQSLLAAFGC